MAFRGVSASTTFHAALEYACTTWRDRPAITWDGRTMTYGELHAHIAALARTYQRLGIGRGDRVVCQLGNRPEHLIALGAAWAVSAIHVGVDHDLTARELDWMLDHTGAAALLYRPPVHAADTRTAMRDIEQAHPSTRIFVLDEGGTVGISLHGAVDAAAGATATLSEDSAPGPDDTAMLLFTSGTTGTPKGSIADHGSFSEGWQSMAAMLDFNPDDVHLVHLPLAHVFGLSMAAMALISGGHIVLEESFSSRLMVERIASQRVTVISGAPAHYILLLRDLDASQHSIASLRAGVGSASLFTRELLAEIFSRLDIDFLLMYGSSEGVGVVTTDREDMLLGSVGRPAPNEVRIVAPDGTPLADGEAGEIAFNRTIAPVRHWGEHVSDVAEAAARSRPGDGGAWYYSGDRGLIDAAGRLHVLGRMKHLIDRGGLKVDPTEVTTVLVRCRGVADAAVIGTPNPVLGESICACVVPVQSAASPSLAALRDELATELARHKLPDELCLMRAIPRTTLGKTDLDALRAAVDASDRESTYAR